MAEEILEIEEGTEIYIVGGYKEIGHFKRQYITPSQIANCYGLNGYPHLHLCYNWDEFEQKRKGKENDYIFLRLRYNYPKVEFIKKGENKKKWELHKRPPFLPGRNGGKNYFIRFIIISIFIKIYSIFGPHLAIKFISYFKFKENGL